MNDSIINEFDTSNNIVIKGNNNDEAVLTTDYNSYLIRSVENSNTIILTGHLKNNNNDNTQHTNKKLKTDINDSSNIITDNNNSTTIDQQYLYGFINQHYELECIQPKFQRLRDILYGSILTDVNADSATVDSDNTNKLYTYNDLLALIQCNKQQLDNALQQYGAIQVNGFVRMLNPDQQATIFDNILNVILKHKMNIKQVNLAIIIDELKHLYKTYIIEHVLKQYSKHDTQNNMCILDSTKICILRAQQLFQRLQPYPHSKFMTDWQDLLPYNIQPSIDMLRGYAIYEPIPYSIAELSNDSTLQLQRTASRIVADNMNRQQWLYFNVDSLSVNVKERFQQLFNRKTKWTINEIIPYVNDICPQNLTVEKFLIKHCRAINDNSGGIKQVVYMKR